MKLFKLYIGCVLITLLACDKPGAPDCLKSSGEESMQSRHFNGFDTLVLEANINLKIVKGPDYAIEVFGGKNLLDKITSNLTGKTLYIKDRNRCQFVRGYKREITLTVRAPYIRWIKSASASSILIDENYAQDTLFIRSDGGDIEIGGKYKQVATASHGNGNITFKGECNYYFAYMNGTNFLYANKGTIHNYFFVESWSVGNIHLKAPDGGGVNYSLNSKGNLYYSGYPAFISGDINGEGMVIKE